MTKAPSIKTYPYVVRYPAGGETFVRTLKQACQLYEKMAAHKPKLLLRTTKGDLVRPRRVDPATGRLHACK